MAQQKQHIRDRTLFDGVFTKYLLKFCFKVLFKLTGWRTCNAIKQGAGITIAAPHTSNWDFLYALGAAILLDKKIYFSIKDSWCKLPIIGHFMMWCGAIPIDRSNSSGGQVAQINTFIQRHRDSDIFFLFTPEGTRSNTKKWRSGFYHVAEGTRLPIFLAKIDYRLKEVGVFHSYQLTGHKTLDMQALQAPYNHIQGKYPQYQYPPYTGPMPTISDAEAAIMQAIYTLQSTANQSNIAAHLSHQHTIASTLNVLLEKGIVSTVDSSDEPYYQLTLTGRGYLCHLIPILR